MQRYGKIFFACLLLLACNRKEGGDLGETGENPKRLDSLQNKAITYLKADSLGLARQYFRQVAGMAIMPEDGEALAVAWNNIGYIFNEQSIYDSALIYYLKARELFLKRKDTLSLAQGLINIGIIYKNQGDYLSAFRRTLEATELLQAKHSKQDLASCYTTLGNVLKEMNRYADGLDYHRKALRILEDLRDSAGMAACLNNIGNIYRHQEAYEPALDHYLRSYEIKKRKGKARSIATTLDNIGETYAKMKKDGLAEEYFSKALALRDPAKDLDGWLTSANRLTVLYLSEGQVQRAREFGQAAIHALPDSGLLKHKLDNSLAMAEVYQKEGDYRNAAFFLQKAVRLKDSIFNENLSQSVSKMNTQYQTAEKIKELETARRLEEADQEKIRLRELFILFLGLLSVALLVVVNLLYRANQYKRQANKRIAFMMKEMDHRVRNNLQLLSGMLTLQETVEPEGAEVRLLRDTRSRIESMNIINGLLYKDAFDGRVEAKAFIEPLAENLQRMYNRPGEDLRIFTDVGEYRPDIDDAIVLGLIINELVTNLYKHNDQFGKGAFIKIGFHEARGRCTLSVTDNCGRWAMDDGGGAGTGFRAGTGDGAGAGAGFGAGVERKGFGLMLIESLAEQLEATSSIEHQDGKTVSRFVYQSNSRG